MKVIYDPIEVARQDDFPILGVCLYRIHSWKEWSNVMCITRRGRTILYKESSSLWQLHRCGRILKTVSRTMTSWIPATYAFYSIYLRFVAMILLENCFTSLQSMIDPLPDLLSHYCYQQSTTLEGACTEYVYIREIDKR